MRWLHAARARLRLLARRDAESRIDHEIDFHIHMETERLMREIPSDPMASSYSTPAQRFDAARLASAMGGAPSRPLLDEPTPAVGPALPAPQEIPAAGHAKVERPESGIDAGRCRRSSLTERVMRLFGTLAAASACAVRSTIRSWNENCQLRRGPREGVTNPARTSARMVLRGSRRSRSTSCKP